jgi:uncharacterized membrane protein
MTVFTIFKFLHVLAVIVWIGGIITVSIVNARIAREKNPAALAAVARQTRFFGAAIVGPAAGLTLIAGIVMIAVSGLGAPLWVIWGFAAIFLSLALGATLIRRAGEELGRTEAAEPGNARVLGLQRRLALLNTLNILLLLSAVGAMVFKPTL